jgi:hypothetical protein
VRDYTGAQAIVEKLEPYRYTLFGADDAGFLAHEVQEAGVPEAVIGEKGAVGPNGDPVYQQVVYQKMVTPLWAVVKDLIKRVGALERERDNRA